MLKAHPKNINVLLKVCLSKLCQVSFNVVDMFSSIAVCLSNFVFVLSHLPAFVCVFKLKGNYNYVCELRFDVTHMITFHFQPISSKVYMYTAKYIDRLFLLKQLFASGSVLMLNIPLHLVMLNVHR